MKLKATLLTIVLCSICVVAQNTQQPTYPGQNAPVAGSVNPGTQQPSGVYQGSQTAAPATTQAATIPAGTQLSIRTNETISATSADVGQAWRRAPSLPPSAIMLGYLAPRLPRYTEPEADSE